MITHLSFSVFILIFLLMVTRPFILMPIAKSFFVGAGPEAGTRTLQCSRAVVPNAEDISDSLQTRCAITRLWLDRLQLQRTVQVSVVNEEVVSG